MTIFDLVAPLCDRIEPVGSRITCNPAPTNTDEDFLILIFPKYLRKLSEILKSDQWKIGGSQGTLDTSEFVSVKKDDLNFIITTKVTFFNKFMVATKVAKKLNLLQKPDRVMLFQAIVSGTFDNLLLDVESKEIDYLAITRSFF